MDVFTIESKAMVSKLTVWLLMFSMFIAAKSKNKDCIFVTGKVFLHML